MSNFSDDELKSGYYDKKCLKCGKIYIGKGNSWYGICQECEKGEQDEKS